MEKTIFEKIVDGEIPCAKVYEDDSTLAFLDINPNSKGHTLLIPKKLYKDIYQLDENISAIMMKNVVKISKAIKKGLVCDGINIVMNNESSAGQIIFHAHIHIIPRYKNDGGDWNKKKNYSELEKEEIIKKITENL